jgi:hypothetical protein
VKLDANFSPDRKYRYRLRRIWSEKPPLVWIMLNPSTADERRDDPTIRRYIARGLNEGYGGVIILNIFAWRSTWPGGLLQTTDPNGPENDGYIERETVSRQVICAWGSLHKSLRQRECDVLEMLSGRTLFYLKINKMTGSPAHPLYLSKKLTMKPFLAEPTGA